MFEFIAFIKKYAFEILLVLCVLFLLGLALYRYGQKGTYDSTYKYEHNIYANNIYTNKKKTPPKESKGELRCRQFLEKTFNKPFPKIRPDFMVNPVTGGQNNLELDCYNSELRLGVEYNGEQHYKYIPFFHKNKEAFLNQKYRDEMKRSRCRELGIKLIEVPYNETNIEDYLVQELNKKGFNV